MGRKVLAVVVALIAALAVITIVKMLKTLTVGLTMDVVALVGYFLGSFAGGYIVKNLSRRESPGMALPLLIGAILTVGGLWNFFFRMPGQPMWLIALSLVTFIPVTLLGAKLAGR